MFVCLGNICRSPTAEAVMARLVSERGVEHLVEVESAGTASWHVGDRPDRAALRVLARHGYRTDHVGRQVAAADLNGFDVLCAMDRSNQRDVLSLATDDGQRRKVILLRSFDPTAPAGAEVPDPWGLGDERFDEVLAMIEAACRGLLDHLLDS